MLATFLLLAVDPLRLSIGRPGEVLVAPGELRATDGGRVVTPADVAKAARGKRFVYLGEQHATEAHQWMEAEIVRALHADGRTVIVGVEMLTRPKQAALDAYVEGRADEATFLTEADWKGQWGFDFAFYRPLFATCRELELPMVALNVPREWVRAVGRGNVEALQPEWRVELPATLEVGAGRHREVFESLLGGHPMTGTAGDRMLAAQTLWDEGMADTALKALGPRHGDPNVVFVVVAGAGHVMYGQGINLRVARRSGLSGLTVVMTTAEGPVRVAKGIGDFVLATPGKG